MSESQSSYASGICSYDETPANLKCEIKTFMDQSPSKNYILLEGTIGTVNTLIEKILVVQSIL